MTDDQWVKERAELTVSNAECAAQLEVTDKELRDSFVRNTVAALQAAITRTREAERTLAAEAKIGDGTGLVIIDGQPQMRKTALAMQEKAVAAERERCAKIADVYAATAPNIDASTNPVGAKIIATVMSDTGRKIATAIRAVADAYAEGQRSMGVNIGMVRIEEAFERGAHSVIARLKNPDEALIEAVGAYLMDPDKRIGAKWADIHPEIRDGYAYEARGVIRALAATLDKEE